MTEKKSPQRVLEPKADQLSFGIDFHPLDGRIYGFVYAHLLSYLAEKNPAAELQPDAPADRLSLAFSTHGRRLQRASHLLSAPIQMKPEAYTFRWSLD
jgi:hypothetical protein